MFLFASIVCTKHARGRQHASVSNVRYFVAGICHPRLSGCLACYQRIAKSSRTILRCRFVRLCSSTENCMHSWSSLILFSQTLTHGERRVDPHCAEKRPVSRNMPRIRDVHGRGNSCLCRDPIIEEHNGSLQ